MRTLMAEDERLSAWIERAKSGDRGAFGSIARQYEARLRAGIEKHLAGLRRRGIDLDDVVQETLLRAFESVSSFEWRGEDSIYPWLFGIAKNVVHKLSEKAVQNRSLELPERLAAREVSPSHRLRREERFDRLEGSLAKLKPEYREVLRLTRLEGLTVKEVARRMDRSEYAVKHLIARALRQLREAVGDTESLHLPPRPLNLKGDQDEQR